MAGKGITKTSFHVDRIDERRGYVPGNLQVLTNTENIKKYLQYSYYEKGKPANFKTITIKPDNESETYPF